MGKMDPTSYDRWWRARINKEEMTYADKGAGGLPRVRESLVLNTLGQPQLCAVAAESHLVGAAALVRKPSRPMELSALAPVSPRKGPGSVAGSVTSKARSKADSVAGSKAKDPDAKSRASGLIPAGGSHAPSYPKTPQFSEARSHTTEVARKLESLEQALAQERAMRLEAEHEMKALLEMATARGLHV